jgi:hypothetical protein
MLASTLAQDSDDIHTSKAPMVTIINVIDLNDSPPRWVQFQYRVEVTENTEVTPLKISETLIHMHSLILAIFWYWYW